MVANLPGAAMDHTGHVSVQRYEGVVVPDSDVPGLLGRRSLVAVEHVALGGTGYGQDCSTTRCRFMPTTGVPQRTSSTTLHPLQGRDDHRRQEVQRQHRDQLSKEHPIASFHLALHLGRNIAFASRLCTLCTE